MTNDAKLGMLAGIAGVLVVAVVYFQKGPAGIAASPADKAAVAGSATAPPTVAPAAVAVPAEGR